MKRISTALLVVAVAATMTHGADAAVKKKKAPPPPTPVTTTYYFHGSGNGNVNAVQEFPGGGGGLLPMDAKAPTSTTDSDYGTFNAANTPNHKCLGNPLTMFPTWLGDASGTLTGKVVVSFFARSTPANATVRLFTDVDDSLACNDTFPPIVAETTVALPVSPTFALVTATLTLPKPVKVRGTLAIEIMPEDTTTPQASDVGFDSTTSPSRVVWSCLPNAGKKTC